MAKFLAWCVHAFTASGLCAAFMAILAIGESNFREAMLWLFLCQIIDGVDGTFARIFRVKEVLPGVSGSTIDYVIDFATYAIIPAYFFYSAELVPQPWALYLTFLILLVSALYYGIDKMVSDDMYFIGFPVMWNMVVLFQYFIFDLSAWGNALLIVFFAILHFIPIKFAYPSRARRFKWLILANTVLFLLAVLGAVWWYPKASAALTWPAIITAAVYGILAVIETLGTDNGKRSTGNGER
jgi:phosphatidylcholine synthase